jgi:hypothetical protein
MYGAGSGLDIKAQVKVGSIGVGILQIYGCNRLLGLFLVWLRIMQDQSKLDLVQYFMNLFGWLHIFILFWPT